MTQTQEAPKKNEFDPNGPIVVTRGFMGGNRFYQANEPFVRKDAGATENDTIDLANAGYIRNGEPVDRQLDPYREERRAKKKAAREAEEARREEEARERAARGEGQAIRGARMARLP